MTTHERRPWFGVCENNACTLNDDDWSIYNLWQRMAQDYPPIEISTFCIMPDHLHGILRVVERMEKPLGVALRAFKSQATSLFRKKHGDPVLTLWAPGYNDHCVWRRGSLSAFTRYIMDNPRRYCLRKAHPDLFRTVSGLRHAALPSSQSWTGYGNRFLLDRPEKRAIRVSRRATPTEIAALRDEILAESAQGVVVVSPFISPGEKEIAKAVLAAPTGDIILLKPDGFPPLFKPSGPFFDLCVQGRLLILSAAAPTANAPTKDVLSRETCLAMNTACAHIADTMTE